MFVLSLMKTSIFHSAAFMMRNFSAWQKEENPLGSWGKFMHRQNSLEEREVLRLNFFMIVHRLPNSLKSNARNLIKMEILKILRR